MKHPPVMILILVCLKTSSGKKWLTLSSFEDGGVPVPVCRYDPPDVALYDDIKPLKKDKIFTNSKQNWEEI
jgi:hypothetical protein